MLRRSLVHLPALLLAGPALAAPTDVHVRVRGQGVDRTSFLLP
jgi:hypothetical protein